MNFGELLEEASGARVAPSTWPLAPPTAATVVAKSIFASSLDLSLPLPTSIWRKLPKGEVANASTSQTTNYNIDNNNREEEYESRSGSDNMVGSSGNKQDTDHPHKKKRYYCHTHPYNNEWVVTQWVSAGYKGKRVTVASNLSPSSEDKVKRER